MNEQDKPQEKWLPQLSNIQTQITAILKTAESTESAWRFICALSQEVIAQAQAYRPTIGGEILSELNLTGTCDAPAEDSEAETEVETGVETDTDTEIETC